MIFVLKKHVIYTRRQPTSNLFQHTGRPGSKALFDRLVAKGKNKKLAVIAVANKLLKQVFGMVKNECLFDRN